MPEDLHISDLMARLGSEPVEECSSPQPLMSRRDYGQLPGPHHQAARHSRDALGQGLPVEEPSTRESNAGRAIESRRSVNKSS